MKIDINSIKSIEELCTNPSFKNSNEYNGVKDDDKLELEQYYNHYLDNFMKLLQSLDNYTGYLEIKYFQKHIMDKYDDLIRIHKKGSRSLNLKDAIEYRQLGEINDELTYIICEYFDLQTTDRRRIKDCDVLDAFKIIDSKTIHIKYTYCHGLCFKDYKIDSIFNCEQYGRVKYIIYLHNLHEKMVNKIKELEYKQKLISLKIDILEEIDECIDILLTYIEETYTKTRIDCKYDYLK